MAITTDDVIFRRTIRLKNGRVIRRANGGVFRIVLRKPPVEPKDPPRGKR